MYPLDSIKVPENFIPEYPYKDRIGCEFKLRDENLMPMPRTEYAVKVNRQEYYASITFMDHHIGRMLDALEESGMADNTYIIFTADHGLSLGDHGFAGKQNMYEHSMRAPFIIAGPGLKKSKIDTPIYIQDAMSTTIDLAGISKPSYVQFKSLMPLIKGKKVKQYDRIYGKFMGLQRMIIEDQMKLIFYPFAEKKMRLYNLMKDPMELHDQIDNPEYSSTVSKLRSDFISLQKDMKDDLDLDEPGEYISWATQMADRKKSKRNKH